MSREDSMVVIARDVAGAPTIWCDPEIADIVAALNAAGIATVASCSGHGHRPGRISFADGREVILPRDDADSRIINEAFPLGINGDATPATTVDETDRLRGIVSGLRGALEHLENANEALASKRSRATYLAMEAEARDELIMLDEARRNARAALSDRPQAEGEVNRG